jgi:hypothetical protein
MTDKQGIVDLVRSGESAVAWVTEDRGRWYGIVFIPDGRRGIQVLGGGAKDDISKAEILRILEETRDESGMPLRIVEGVDGIAACDPHWDGSPTFVCRNPACGLVHDIDENTAINIIRGSHKRQGTKNVRPAVHPGRRAH